MRRSENGARRSSRSVSGWRQANQTMPMMPSASSATKISRQSPTSSSTCPTEGATTGTMMKMPITMDMIFAIARPE